MHDLLQKMIHIAKKNKTGIPDKQVNKLTDKYISILELAANEYENNPPTKDYMDGFNLQKKAARIPRSPSILSQTSRC